jgi:hypothetical protein
VGRAAESLGGDADAGGRATRARHAGVASGSAGVFRPCFLARSFATCCL